MKNIKKIIKIEYIQYSFIFSKSFDEIVVFEEGDEIGDGEEEILKRLGKVFIILGSIWFWDEQDNIKESKITLWGLKSVSEYNW